MNVAFQPIWDKLGITVLERGWLSSNNTVITHGSEAWVIDTGYSSHAEQTVALIAQAIGSARLCGILNTHLHSDHCGGNAALRNHHPAASILIPPGQAALVDTWDTDGLTYTPTGQHCPRFSYDGLLAPGTNVRLGGFNWDIVAAPGHDPHAVLLFEPEHRVLVSGDALWENGFGVVFPELEGQDAFEAVGGTLRLIKQLRPSIVIPGHGRPFNDVPAALNRADTRLQQFRSRPEKHAEYAAKVLVKFHLLERQQTTLQDLNRWYTATPYFRVVGQHYPQLDLSIDTLLSHLGQAGAVKVADGLVYDQ
jgi:glyoxylase-like metal-dependent hydrolase (beta-lactamase superfamily II)